MEWEYVYTTFRCWLYCTIHGILAWFPFLQCAVFRFLIWQFGKWYSLVYNGSWLAIKVTLTRRKEWTKLNIILKTGGRKTNLNPDQIWCMRLDKEQSYRRFHDFPEKRPFVTRLDGRLRMMSDYWIYWLRLTDSQICTRTFSEVRVLPIAALYCEL